MTKTKNDRYFANKLAKEVEKLIRFAERVNFSEPERNEEAIYAMNFCLVQIRENLARLSDAFLRERIGIKTAKFIDFRNLLVHEYGQTDYSAYKDLVDKDIRYLKKQLDDYLSS